MNKISDLQYIYARFKLGLPVGSSFINWAMDRLQANEEGDDLDVVLLASATAEEESIPLAEAVLRRYMSDAVDLEFIAGKEIVNLRSQYLKGEISINDLDTIISALYPKLEHPDWLTMLSRNCEYATDIENFRQPFEKEFEYIAKGWAASSTTTEFKATYCREVSNTHDVLLPK